MLISRKISPPSNSKGVLHTLLENPTACAFSDFLNDITEDKQTTENIREENPEDFLAQDHLSFLPSNVCYWHVPIRTPAGDRTRNLLVDSMTLQLTELTGPGQKETS